MGVILLITFFNHIAVVDHNPEFCLGQSRAHFAGGIKGHKGPVIECFCGNDPIITNVGYYGVFITPALGNHHDELGFDIGAFGTNFSGIFYLYLYYLAGKLQSINLQIGH